MVTSPYARKISISISSPRTTEKPTAPPPSQIFSITLTWGRGNLFTAPQKRAAQVEFVLDTWDADRLGRFWIGSEITIKNGIYPIFIGVVTDFTPGDDYNTEMRICRINCQEVYGQQPLLFRTIDTNANTPTLLQSSLNIQAGGFVKPEVRDPVPATTRFDRAGRVQETVSVFAAYGALVASRPLAFPQWSVDYREVRPTIYAPVTNATFRIPPKYLVILEPVSYSINHLPSHVSLKSGGTFGTERTMTAWTTPYTGGKMKHEVSVKADFACVSWDNNAITKAQKLVNIQRANPRRIGISDVLFGTEFQKYEALFNAYESPMFSFNPLYSTPEMANQYLVAIGGTLTITQQETTHDMICIYCRE